MLKPLVVLKVYALGGIIAPNFSIGVILLMKAAQLSAKYLPNAEIIEYHHDQKQDAPSATAIKTAELISEARAGDNYLNPDIDNESAARGARLNNIQIHALRLPGVIANQAVVFGGLDETLTIRHDSLSRQCFMPGVCLSCEKVTELDGLVYGLEHIL